MYIQVYIGHGSLGNANRVRSGEQRFGSVLNVLYFFFDLSVYLFPVSQWHTL